MKFITLVYVDVPEGVLWYSINFKISWLIISSNNITVIIIKAGTKYHTSPNTRGSVPVVITLELCSKNMTNIFPKVSHEVIKLIFESLLFFSCGC